MQRRKLVRVFATLCALLSLFGCRHVERGSDGLVAEVPQTTVQRQTGGSCWIFAITSWLEALHLKATGAKVDISEGYFLWWHIYEQVVDSEVLTVADGASFTRFRGLAKRHGYALQSEFSSDSFMLTDSYKASKAVLESELKPGGRLGAKESRTPENVTAVLNELFFVSMPAEPFHKASDLVVPAPDGSASNLKSLLAAGGSKKWRYTDLASELADGEEEDAGNAADSAELLLAAKIAMNDGWPLLMSVRLDFNGIDRTRQIFSRKLIDAAGGPGRQGNHLVVLTDYTVKNVPGYGSLGEGLLSEELQELALAADLDYVKAKNSWGVDRPEIGVTDGYLRFDAEYLTTEHQWIIKGVPRSGPALRSLMLPPGYLDRAKALL